jgi:sulfide dehydrogenase cytochrome subunit
MIGRNFMNQLIIRRAFVAIAGFVLLHTAAFAEDVETLVKQCAMCHGSDGNSKTSAFPSFGGISKQYFKHTMDAYQHGGRKSDIMKNYVKNLSPEDIDKLAEYYSKQSFEPAEQKYDPQLAAQGETLHTKYCAKCHDSNGKVDPYNYGILAGQWMPYLTLAIKEYLEGTRRVNPMMVKKLKRVQNEVGPEGFEQLVNFYASVK